MSELRITVVGGGPVGLTFALLAASTTAQRDVRIRVLDHRWRNDGGTVSWKGAADGNRRRHQVMTVQSRQYTLLPRRLFDALFRPRLVAEIWPSGSDSVDGLPPLNIRIADLEDGLLECAARCSSIELCASAFDVEADLDDLRGEHLVVVADGAGSPTRDQLGIFGQPGLDVFAAHGQPIHDVVLGLQVRSNVPPPAVVLLTLAQNRFLLNPAADGTGFLNMRLTAAEAAEAVGFVPGAATAAPCTQRQPCLPRAAQPGSAGVVFAPALGEASALWPRVLDGLRLFDVARQDLTAITSYELSMVQRPRFSSVLFHRTATQPATIAALLGDAAISVHFWPGRGLNTGIASAACLAASIAETWRGSSFREADFGRFEARMAELQHRNQTRGFYGCMRVDDVTGSVTPIKHLVGAAHRGGPPSIAEHARHRTVMAARAGERAARLARRLPGLVASDLAAVAERLDAVTPETLRDLVASGPWDTYRPGGPEVELDVERRLASGWDEVLPRSA